MYTHVILILAAFATATLSGMLGMGGGMLLLAVMFCFMDHGSAIPVHAVVQLSSNSTRAIVFAKSADGPTLRRFLIGVIPGTAAGTLALWQLGKLGDGEPYLKLVVGVYVLLAPYVRFGKQNRDEQSTPWTGEFTAMGFLAGLMSLTVGATGPLIAPLFARHHFVKERLIATKALCQVATHVLKLPAFIILGTFGWGELGYLALPMAVVVVPATLLGKRLLANMPASQFTWLYRAALVVAGVKIIVVDGIVALVS